MLPGEERFKKRRFCIANKHGFISAYGVALFMICLVFVTMCVSQLRLQLLIQQTQKQHLLEVFIIRYIAVHSAAMTEEASEEADMLFYQDIVIELTRDLPIITAEYVLNHHTYHLSFTLDDTNHIIDLAYS